MAIQLQRRVPGIAFGKIAFRTQESNVATLIRHIAAASRRVSTGGQLSLAGAGRGKAPEPEDGRDMGPTSRRGLAIRAGEDKGRPHQEAGGRASGPAGGDSSSSAVAPRRRRVQRGKRARQNHLAGVANDELCCRRMAIGQKDGGYIKDAIVWTPPTIAALRGLAPPIAKSPLVEILIPLYAASRHPSSRITSKARMASRNLANVPMTVLLASVAM
jgi:hypothetical protein